MDVESIRHAYLRRLVAPVFRTLGFRFTRAVATRLAGGIHGLHPPGTRRAAERLAKALALENRTQVDERVADLYRQQGAFWAECLFIRRRMAERSRRSIIDLQGSVPVGGSDRSARGCILTTAYYGNPAVAACALGRLFRPVHVVVDWIATPSLRAWQHEMYRMPFVEPLARNEAARRVPDILERGGAVLLIAEHERRRGPAAEVRFLGRRLRLYPTIARLARWFDVPIVPVVCRRVGGRFRFVVEFGEAIDPSRKNTSTSIRALAPSTADPGCTPAGPPSIDTDTMQRVMASLERMILRDPNQYLWSIETLGGAPEGGRATFTGRETETASSRRARRKTSASQWPSAAGRPPVAGAGALEAGPAPTA